jgi:dTDP-L-rhamnose 4-epimerase
VYAATKLHQEHLAQIFSRETGIPVTVLRYHNVYGPRMPRDTPYAGVASIFRSALAGGRPPPVFEDGGQLRDFVHVSDVVQACVLAMAAPAADGQVLNVGSGRPVSVRDVASVLARELNWTGGFEVTGKFRAGDVRHCFADISRARSLLGYAPRRTFGDGVRELVAWVSSQQGASASLAEEAQRELAARGLVR